MSAVTAFGSGTPITGKSLNTAFSKLQVQIDSLTASPIGSIIMWAGTTANIPTGYAVCNGASLVKNDYLPLWNLIGYQYGGSGANFTLPDFTSRMPEGITGVPTVPATDTTSASSAVDVHTHTVNSSLTAGNTNTSLTAGNAASHVHSNTFTAGNAADHYHNHTIGTAVGDHQHTYFKPNSGGNNVTFGNGNAGAAHSHGINGNIGAADRTLSVNSSFTSGGVNTAIGVNTSLTAGSVNTSLTAGNASTINSSTTAHTHTINVTQVIFIIKVV
ncbi:MdpB Microcystin-dependent protein [uncultured Caudovirales phage]|uniref:MdpB Microcystin-dependent protein n=1 Tax=uncultured Caudovirales phage TaxID=2100421 RepID=A0A6J5RCD1_9CAUD|nr:MdpB Microcystin-dependent protein [uncultured Caudovirales phage]CAB4176702.1 MdpB Microcystin-dependent protein [uncultured Caudovirales phage]CAB4191418.1 MdpB Microcystin-dependent protein [uncultured Caudovirales phage]CAB4223191.1 MdpB Microcystin-dependent protein [uncultured Caudovirales phage]CAB5220491.1 MdpB Microcystin-dependent protein [uncultured Caudovirales phage]